MVGVVTVMMGVVTVMHPLSMTKVTSGSSFKPSSQRELKLGYIQGLGRLKMTSTMTVDTMSDVHM